MTVTPVELIAPQDLTNAFQNLIVGEPGTVLTVDKMTFSNTDASNRTVTVAVNSKVITSQVILPGRTFNDPNIAGQNVVSTDTVEIKADANSVVVVWASGRSTT